MARMSVPHREPAADEGAPSLAVSVRPLPPGALARLVTVIRPVRLDAVMEALVPLAPRDVVIEPVRGYGRQKTHLDLYEEGVFEEGFLPKVRLQFVVEGDRLQDAVAALRLGARTGRIGDGKIFVHAVTAPEPPAAEPTPPDKPAVGPSG
jgi:nitrogen regulatory protein PII